MLDKQELKLYIELNLDDMIENKSQEVFDRLATEKLEKELIEVLGDDYSHYAETKTIKTIAIPKEDGAIIVECIIEVTAKPEGIKDLFNTIERLQIGM